MISKYLGTIVGLIIAMIGVLSMLNDETMLFMFTLTLLFLVIVLPLEILGQILFDDYALVALVVLLGLLIAFFISTSIYFKKLISDRNKNIPFNRLNFWVFLLVQFIIVHPLVFYVWAFINSKQASDGQFVFGIIETFPISSFLFLVIGIAIDYLRHLPNISKNRDNLQL